MRNMSFSLTTDQIKAGTKSVTRRLGWLNLKPGQQVMPVKKCMGLRPGEKIERLRDPVTVVTVRREPLQAMLDSQGYGHDECEREGFPKLYPAQFVEMFCKTHKGCTPTSIITRIEFSY